MKKNLNRAASRSLALNFLFFVLALLRPSLAQQEFPASDDLVKGRAAFRAGQFDEAIARFEKVKPSDTNHALAMAYRAGALVCIHKLAEAEASLSQLLEKYPESIFALATKAQVLKEAGKPDKAGALADYVTKLTPRTAQDYSGRASAHLLKDNIDAAILDYSKAIELDPSCAETYDSRGLAFGQKKEFQSEIDDHTKAIEIDPKAAIAYMNRGAAYGYQQKYDNALQDYDRAIELNPRLAMAYANRGATRRIRNHLDGALADYNKAIEIDEKLPIAYYNRGVAWRHKNDFSKAIEDYTKAIALKLDYQEAYHSRGVAHFKIGNKAEACRDWKKACDIAPGTATGQSAYRNWEANCEQ